MKNNDKIRKFEIGDKLVISEEGKKYYNAEENYWEEDMESLKDSLYALVVDNDAEGYSNHIIVNWYNHKGMVVRAHWYMLKKYAELYES